MIIVLNCKISCNIVWIQKKDIVEGCSGCRNTLLFLSVSYLSNSCDTGRVPSTSNPSMISTILWQFSHLWNQRKEYLVMTMMAMMTKMRKTHSDGDNQHNFVVTLVLGQNLWHPLWRLCLLAAWQQVEAEAWQAAASKHVCYLLPLPPRSRHAHPSLFTIFTHLPPLGIIMSRLIWCTGFRWFPYRVFSSCQQTEASSSFKSCLHLAPAFWACALSCCAAIARAAHT